MEGRRGQGNRRMGGVFWKTVFPILILKIIWPLLEHLRKGNNSHPKLKSLTKSCWITIFRICPVHLAFYLVAVIRGIFYVHVLMSFLCLPMSLIFPDSLYSKPFLWTVFFRHSMHLCYTLVSWPRLLLNQSYLLLSFFNLIHWGSALLGGPVCLLTTWFWLWHSFLSPY